MDTMLYTAVEVPVFSKCCLSLLICPLSPTFSRMDACAKTLPCFTFLLFRPYLKNKRTLGYLVTEKLASLCLKEMENCVGAK